LTITALLASLLLLVGYLYRISDPYPINRYASRTLYTAVTFLVLALGILLARPDRGLMWVLRSDTTGGLLTRRVVPAVVSVPLVLGWLQLLGQQAGLYNTAFGAAIFAITSIAVLTAIVLWSARFLIQEHQGQAEEGEAQGGDDRQASRTRGQRRPRCVWNQPLVQAEAEVEQGLQ
jgi:hypothetical protein